MASSQVDRMERRLDEVAADVSVDIRADLAPLIGTVADHSRILGSPGDGPS